MVRECMLSTVISTVFTEEGSWKLSLGEQDLEAATAKDPFLSVECRVGQRQEYANYRGPGNLGRKERT